MLERQKSCLCQIANRFRQQAVQPVLRSAMQNAKIQDTGRAQYALHLLNSVSALRSSGDVVISCEGQSEVCRAHSIVLASVSPVFRSFLTSSHGSQTLLIDRLSRFERDVLSLFFDVIYECRVPPETSLNQLLALSSLCHRFEIVPLLVQLEAAMLPLITNETAFGAFLVLVANQSLDVKSISITATVWSCIIDHFCDLSVDFCAINAALANSFKCSQTVFSSHHSRLYDFIVQAIFASPHLWLGCISAAQQSQHRNLASKLFNFRRRYFSTQQDTDLLYVACLECRQSLWNALVQQFAWLSALTRLFPWSSWHFESCQLCSRPPASSHTVFERIGLAWPRLNIAQSSVEFKYDHNSPVSALSIISIQNDANQRRECVCVSGIDGSVSVWSLYDDFQLMYRSPANSTFHIWSLASSTDALPEFSATYRQHPASIEARFSDESDPILLSGRSDGRVEVHLVSTSSASALNSIGSFHAHQGAVMSMQLRQIPTPEQHRRRFLVATGGTDKCVRLFLVSIALHETSNSSAKIDSSTDSTSDDSDSDSTSSTSTSISDSETSSSSSDSDDGRISIPDEVAGDDAEVIAAAVKRISRSKSQADSQQTNNFSNLAFTGAATMHQETQSRSCFVPMSVERLAANRGEASWQLADVHLIGSMFGHLSAVNSVLLHPDQWTLYSASDDRSMREWDLGPLVQSIVNDSVASESVEIPSQRFFSLHRDWITSLCWAPVFIDNRHQLLLCSSSDDSSVRLWCPDSKQCVSTVFSQSQHSVRAVTFLPPRDAASIGTLILACSSDCEAWSIRVDGTTMSSSFLRSLPAHSAQLTCIRSVGCYLLTGSEDGTVEVRL